MSQNQVSQNHTSQNLPRKETMKAVVYEGNGILRLEERPIPHIMTPRDAVVRVTLTTICSSDIHILHGAVPRAVPGTILGHEFVGIVEETGSEVTRVKPGDRVAVNVETFCGECFYCQRGYVYWGAGLAEIGEGGTAAVIGAGPTGLCTMMCARLYHPGKLIAIDTSQERLELAKRRGLADYTLNPRNENVLERVLELTSGRGADSVLEVAGGKDTFQMAWQIARPNAVVCVAALYEEPQVLPLPSMYGKNLIFKTGGVDANSCSEILKLIEEGKLDTGCLITHRTDLAHILEAYEIFEKQADHVIKYAITI